MVFMALWWNNLVPRTLRLLARVKNLALAVLLYGLCTPASWGQANAPIDSLPPGLPSGHLETRSLDAHHVRRYWIPDSSVEKLGDRGIRSHTHYHFCLPPAGVLGNPIPSGTNITATAGETPASLRQIYGLPSNGGSGVIAIIDAYDYPTALGDFNTYSQTFGLPTETSTNVNLASNSVLQVIYASGSRPNNSTWLFEESLDIEVAHAMAPNAKIVLIEAAGNDYNSLMTAVQVANAIPNVKEVSMSFGGSEFLSEKVYDSNFTHPGITYYSGSGDSAVVEWPAISSNVVGVGGTEIMRDSSGNFLGETGWDESGGGVSVYEPRPADQNILAPFAGNFRVNPDISCAADASDYGVEVYCTNPGNPGYVWWDMDGTSVAGPLVAGIVNLASTVSGTFAASSAAERAIIYSNMGGAGLRDIVSGTTAHFSCAPGWDFVTGVGSPYGLNAVSPGVPADPSPVVEVQTPAGTILASGGTNSVSMGSPAYLSGTQTTLTVLNVGPVTLSNVSVAVSGNASFAVGAPSATTLAPFASATFTVFFTPQSVGAQDATLSVTGSGVVSNFATTLTGTGTGSTLAITYPNGVPLSTGTSLNLGSIGVLSGTQTILAVKNLGPLTVTNLATALSPTANFTVSAPAATTLAPLASTTFTVSFLPQAPGAQSALLGVTGSGATSAFGTMLTGSGVGAVIAVDSPAGTPLSNGTTNSVSVGSAGVLTATQTTFTVQNSGLGTLSNLSVFVSGNSAFTSGSPGLTTLAPGQSTTFTVFFQPQSVGTSTATLSITGSDTTSIFQTTVLGTGVGGAVSVDFPSGTPLANGTANSVNIGAINLLSSEQAMLTIQNTGIGTISNLSAAVYGDSAFSVGAPATTTLAPGQSTTVAVSFLPQTLGTQSATLCVSGSGVTSTFETTIIGAGVQGAIAVAYPVGVPLTNGTANSVNLGSVGVLTGTQATFTVQNTGLGTLSNLAVAVSGNPAFAAGAPAAMTLGPGQSTTFAISYSPQAVGNQSATLTVTGSGVPANFETTIIGTGVGGAIAAAYPAGVPLVSGSGSVSLGSVGLQSGTQAALTVTNVGAGVISNLSASGSGSTAFTVGAPGATTLAPGQSTTLTVSFLPRSVGAQNSTLTLSGSSVASPFQVGLTGTGVGATITVACPVGTPLSSGSSTINFGTAFVSARTALTVEVLNNSPTNLTLSRWSIVGANASDFSANIKVPATILPGGTASFALVFNPQATGTRTTGLQLASNDFVTPSFNISLTGTAISFAELPGKYAGYLDDGILSLTLTKTGAFTGKLLLNGETISIKGAFGADGTFSGTFGKPPVLITLILGPSGITGFAGGEPLTVYRSDASVEKAIKEAGNYTFLLTGAAPSTATPAGTGYGTLKVSAAGNISMAGKLADGTAFSTRGLVVEDGTGEGFVVFVPGLYKGGRGYISGSVGFDGYGPYYCDGSFEWHKPKQSGTTGYYPDGFDTTLNLNGAPYTVPARGSTALPFANGMVEISGGSIPFAITDTVALSPASTITVLGGNSAKVKLSVTAATGYLTGSFVHPITAKTVRFGGVLFKDPANPCAAGFFLGPIVSGSGSSGSITVTPNP